MVTWYTIFYFKLFNHIIIKWFSGKVLGIFFCFILFCIFAL